MVEKNQIIKVLGISTAIVLSNPTLATAASTLNQNFQHNQSLSNTNDISANTEPILLSAKALPESISVDPQKRQLSNFSEPISSSSEVETIAQTFESTTDIIKPPQEPIRNTDTLNPSANPLSFPTEPAEVEVDLQKPITIEQAIELSLKNNRDIEEARIVVEQSQAALREARAALLPTLNLSSQLNFSNELFLDSITTQVLEDNQQLNATSSAETSSFTTATDLTLSYNIYDGGFRGANIRTAEKQLRSNELNLEVVVEQTRLETAEDYYDLQNTDAQVEIQKAAVEDASQTLKDAQLLERAGLGTRFDVLRAEVELSQARQTLSTAIANQNIARRQLAETLSIDHSADLTTADAIEEAGTWEFSLPESIVQAFKNRAELEQLLLQREISDEQRKAALSQIRPTVSASASYDLNDDFEDQFDISDSYTVGLNLNWTLFDGGAARADAEQSEKDIEIAESNFADQRNLIRFAVEQAFFGLESNQKNIGTASQEVELAEESLRLARLRFQAGVGTQTDVIEAQTDLTEARGDLLSSIIDYNLSYINLQRQVSNTPDNGLQDLP